MVLPLEISKNPEMVHGPDDAVKISLPPPVPVKSTLPLMVPVATLVAASKVVLPVPLAKSKRLELKVWMPADAVIVLLLAVLLKSSTSPP